MNLRERLDHIQDLKNELLQLVSDVIISGLPEEEHLHHSKIVSLKRNIILEEWEANADPDSFDNVYMWIVEISSRATVGDVETIASVFKTIAPDENCEVMSDANLTSETRKTAEDAINKWLTSSDPLYAEVMNKIREQGYQLTSTGGGEGGWSVSFYCNEPRSRQLCSLIHTEFKEYIDTDILHITRNFWRVGENEGIRFAPPHKDFYRKPPKIS